MITAADALVLGAYSCSGNHHQSLGIMPKAKTRIKDILLYLALLRAGSPVAEIRRETEMAKHSAKTHIALVLLTTPDLIHCGRHVVTDPASGDTTQYT